MMAVMAIAFTQILKVKSEDYILYLLCSLLPWTFLNESVEASANSIINSEPLLRSQYLPKIIFPIKEVAYSMVTFTLSLFAFLLFYFLYKFKFPLKIYYIIISLPLIVIFSAGLGILVSVMTIYIRDTQYLLSVLFRAWFYLTPVLYPLDILPPDYQFYLLLNPATHFIQLFTEPIHKNISPGIFTYAIATGLTIASWVAGAYLMTRYEKKIIFRL